MSGVDAVGLIALSITLFNGCLQGFSILCRAQQADREVASVRLMLELEQHKLFTWAEEIGLLSDPPQLNVTVPDVEFVNAILRKLGELLIDVQNLRFKYGLRIETTTELIEDVDDDLALCRMQVQSPSELQKWQDTTVQIFHARTQPWRKLKWVIVDEQHFRKLLGDINYFTSELYRFLEHGKRKEVETQHNTLLRSTIINTTSQLALEVIGRDPQVISANSAVAATARFKRKRLRLGFFDRFKRTNSNGSTTDGASDASLLLSRQTSFAASPNDSRAESRKLSSKFLTLAHIPQPSEFRQLAYYQFQPVLIEWRPILPSTWAQARDRVERLSGLLSELDPSSFHSLPCRGYVLNKEAGRYGFVFDIPDTSTCKTSPSVPDNHSKQLPALPTMATLRTLLGKSKPVPSLNERVKYAIVLLETLLQLHTAGWLHKELRPDNIVTLHNPECRSHVTGTADSMYIAGYAYARSDGASDFTEPSQDAVEAQLYRHPLSLGINREPYCKSFDLFSIGCILLEIGLWSRLSTILTSLMDISRPADIKQNTAPIDSHVTHTYNPPIRLQPTISPVPLPNRSPRKSEDIPRPNLMYLRRVMLQQLQIQLSSQNPPTPSNHNRGTNIDDDSEGEGNILKTLEAQTGRQYTRIILDCLRAFSYPGAAIGDHCGGEQVSAEFQLTEDRRILRFEEKSLKSLRDLLEVL